MHRSAPAACAENVLVNDAPEYERKSEHAQHVRVGAELVCDAEHEQTELIEREQRERNSEMEEQALVRTLPEMQEVDRGDYIRERQRARQKVDHLSVYCDSVMKP